MRLLPPHHYAALIGGQGFSQFISRCNPDPRSFKSPYSVLVSQLDILQNLLQLNKYFKQGNRLGIKKFQYSIQKLQLCEKQNPHFLNRGKPKYQLILASWKYLRAVSRVASCTSGTVWFFGLALKREYPHIHIRQVLAV